MIYKTKTSDEEPISTNKKTVTAGIPFFGVIIAEYGGKTVITISTILFYIGSLAIIIRTLQPYI